MKYLKERSKEAPISIRLIIWNRASGVEPYFKNFKHSEEEKSDDKKAKEEEEDDDDDEAKAAREKKKTDKEDKIQKAAEAEDERKKGDFSKALDLLRNILTMEEYREMTKVTTVIRCVDDGDDASPDPLGEKFKKYNSPYIEYKKPAKVQLKKAKKNKYRDNFILLTSNRSAYMKAEKLVEPHGVRRLPIFKHRPSKALAEKARLVHEADPEPPLDNVSTLHYLPLRCLITPQTWSFAVSYVLEHKKHYGPKDDKARFKTLFPS